MIIFGTRKANLSLWCLQPFVSSRGDFYWKIDKLRIFFKMWSLFHSAVSLILSKASCLLRKSRLSAVSPYSQEKSGSTHSCPHLVGAKLRLITFSQSWESNLCWCHHWPWFVGVFVVGGGCVVDGRGALQFILQSWSCYLLAVGLERLLAAFSLSFVICQMGINTHISWDKD